MQLLVTKCLSATARELVLDIFQLAHHQQNVCYGNGWQSFETETLSDCNFFPHQLDSTSKSTVQVPLLGKPKPPGFVMGYSAGFRSQIACTLLALGRI